MLELVFFLWTGWKEDNSWLESFRGFVVVVEARVQKMLLGWKENLVSFYLTTCKWASICLAKRKMISLFRKIVLLATIFFLRLWLRKRSILKSFSGTKKVFLWIFFWKKNLRLCLLSRRMNWTNTCVTRTKILGCCILSVLWVRKLFSLFFFFFFFFLLVLLSENGDRVSCCYFLNLFRNAEGAMRGHQF